MNRFIASMAEELKFSQHQIENGLGAFLTCVNKYSKPENYHIIVHSLHNSDVLLDRFHHLPAQQNIGNILDLSRSLFGVQSIPLNALMHSFSKGGYSTMMVKKFLPILLYKLKHDIPADVFKQLLVDFPGLQKFIHRPTHNQLYTKH